MGVTVSKGHFSGHGRFHSGRQSLSHFPGCLIGDEPCSVQVHNHIGTVVLNGLEGAYGPTELFPFSGISNGHVENGLEHTDHLSTFTYRGLLPQLFQMTHSLPEGSQHIFFGDPDLIENHLTLPVKSQRF